MPILCESQPAHLLEMVMARKALVQVTEEEKHIVPGGDSKIVRLTSTSDLNGRFQPVRREIVETKSIGMDTEETNSTVMLTSINGGWAPAVKTHELRKRAANDTLETEKTTWLPDVNGNWQVSEVRQAITRQEGTNRITEERVSRPDSEGKLGRSLSRREPGVREHFRRKTQRRGNLFHRCPGYHAGR